jgi:dihydroxyacetone kinase-like protein
MERTKDMTAALGRAKTLGERARGHVDPGALSVAVLLKGMADHLRTEPRATPQ